MRRLRLTLLSVRVYSALLWLYPPAHRDEYGGQMRQAFGDQCRAADMRGGRAWLGLWWRTFGDVMRTVMIEHLAARKARLMHIDHFRNQPDLPTSVLFLIPGLLLTFFYAITIHNGETTGYMLAALVGVVGYGLGTLKILRRLRIWGQYVLGFGMGAGCFIALSIWSPMANLGIPALNTPAWRSARLLMALVICLVMIVLLARWIRYLRRVYWVVAAILLCNGLALALLSLGPNEFFLWNLTWRWGYVASILTTVALGHRLSRRTGLLGLLAMIVALGTLYTVNLTMADVAQGKTPYGQIILTLVYVVPLVICPAWLLLARGWHRKKYGVLLSWAAMLVVIGVVMPLLDRFLEPHFFRWMNPGILLYSVMVNSPLLIGLWLAFALYEKQHSLPGESDVYVPD